MLSWIDIGSSIARDEVKLFFWAQDAFFREIMAIRLCKCLVNNINVNSIGIVKKMILKRFPLKGLIGRE